MLLSVAAAAAVAVTVAVTATGAHATTGASGGAAMLQALGRGIVVGVPLAVALYACRRPAHARFGRLLLAFGAVWFMASLSSSASPVVYSVGRVAGWVAEVALAWALLAFPSGRLETKVDRSLIAVSVGVAVALYLPTALLVWRYPTPTPWAACDAGCPHNAFIVLHHQPAFIDGFVVPVRMILTALVFVAVAAVLAARIRAANTLMRRAIVPLLAVSSVRALLFAAAVVMRGVSPHSPAMHVMMWVLALLVPGICIAFVAGLVRWHLFVTAGIGAVNARLREMPGPEQVRELLASAFDDPGLQIGSWSGRRHRWIDSGGQPLEQPDAAFGRHLTEVRDDRRPVAAILHDVALAEDSAFIEAAAAAASVAFATDRVAARTSGLVRELRASRARIVAAADSERRRIERDLHDGAQQHLVGLCVHLELAAERAKDTDPAQAAKLRELVGQVDQALEEMRSLTRGIYPRLLADRGLEVAVRSAAMRSPVPTALEVKDLGEYPNEITSAVYFCCVEALQNVAKHAHGARSARIVLREAGSVLSFSVSDDGPGLIDHDARVGSGLLNMRDRMTTVGGKLTVDSRPGQGTRVSGRIPLAAIARADAPHHGDGPASSRTTTARRRDRAQP